MNGTENSGNRLRDETSPYLRQHANNPVDWYPWGDEALNRAKAENKPILLSIGYSACHWCHVMAHESFENAATAAVMNELFVNIKVDREERPDLDKIYQLAHQLLTRRPGGWPLTVFLDPHNHLPYFAGTYFPNTPRLNLPGFSQILPRIAAYYHERPDDLLANQKALRDVLMGLGLEQQTGEAIDERLLVQAEDAMAANFDPVHGGFGHAPKFPHASDLAFLLGRGHSGRAVKDRSQQIVDKTLTAMAYGGLFDQVGGGFFRYSVDARWEIPHFEKMLYDNGPLLWLYTEAWKITGIPLFRRIAEETAEWALREMQADGGAFYSSLDADSEGIEGKYYAWDRREIAAVLPADEYRVFEAVFGLNETPNFEGRWHLHRVKSTSEAAQQTGCSHEQVEARIAQSCAKLRARRDGRVCPGRDEKILVAWNALMIKGLAAAGRVFGRSDWSRAAHCAFDFLYRNCWVDGRLRAGWKDGKAPLNAYLDDYVMLIDAALELLQVGWRSDVLEWAMALADGTLAQFEDGAAGGFFFTSVDHEELIHRPKPLMDESLPSGNGVAASVLMKLGWLLGNHRYTDAAERALRAAMPAVCRYPEAHGALLDAAQQWLHPPAVVVLRGKREDLEPWHTAIRGFSGCLAVAIPVDVDELPGDLAGRKAMPEPVAYVCTGGACLPAIQSIEDLSVSLRTIGVGEAD